MTDPADSGAGVKEDVMTQAATLEEPKRAATISELAVLVSSVPKLHLDIIEEARKANADSDAKRDARAVAMGEPPHEVIEAAWERTQRIETIIAASAQIITGRAADSPRFDDIRVAIREAVRRVREHGRATINKVRSLNVIDRNTNAVISAAFNAVEESAERLSELSQVPLRSQSSVVASEVGQDQSAPGSPAAEKTLTNKQAAEMFARLTNTKPDSRRARRELKNGRGCYTELAVLRAAISVIEKRKEPRPSGKKRCVCPSCSEPTDRLYGHRCRECFAKEHGYDMKSMFDD